MSERNSLVIKKYTVAVSLTLGIAVLLIAALLTVVLGNDAMGGRLFTGSVALAVIQCQVRLFKSGAK